MPLDNVADIRTPPGDVQTNISRGYYNKPMNYTTVTPTNQGTTNGGVQAFKQAPNPDDYLGI